MKHSSSTIQFISQTKLEELSHQRERLLTQYQELLDRSRAAEGTERLRILREGLSRVGLKSTRPSFLHRNLPNLDALVAGQSCSEELFEFWVSQLEAEIERGRKRAETVYVFGALLGEWDDTEDSEALRQEAEAHERLLTAVWSSPRAAPQKVFASVLARFTSQRERIQQAVSAAIAELEVSGVFAGWRMFRNSAHVSAEVRQEVRRFLSDPVLEQQLDDALAVATRDPRVWNWPSSGVDSVALWTRNKWRLYPRLSLVEYAVVDGCSTQWIRALNDNFCSLADILHRQGRINQLRDLNAPEVIYQNEIRMLKKAQESTRFGWYEPVDPWTGLATIGEEERAGGVASRRAREQVELRDSWAQGYYGEGAIPMVRLVHAELQVLRAACPEQPLHVAKLDVANFFADVPHEVLLTMLDGLGMNADGVAFARRFLETPWRQNGEMRNARRGVPMEQSLSHWLCETLMRLLESHVHQSSRVRVIRQLDDICLLAPDATEILKAWNAVVEFLADVGLAVNQDKCGAVTLDGPAVEQLPTAPPFWGMVQLTAEGEWTVHQTGFDSFLETTREQINSRHSVFSKVMAYNDHLGFLTTALGVAMDLGQSHRDSINVAMKQFEEDLFAPGRGIATVVLDAIAERYTDHAVDLPESWMAWPVTAGGLGLRRAGIIRAQYQMAFDERTDKRRPVPGERPAEWQWGSREWAEYYEDQLESLSPASCRDSARMRQLVESFIRRGKSISGGQQEGLSEYWRWVLSTHGPVILDRFGTFEFLLSDLVPLQLIQEKLLQRGVQVESGSRGQNAGD